MAMILPQKGGFGQTLGTGLGQALEGLAGDVGQGIQQRRQQESLFTALQGLMPNESEESLRALSK